MISLLCTLPTGRRTTPRGSRVLTALLLMILPAAGGAAQQPKDIVFATTTSVHDTGLLDSLLPRFEAATGYRVKTIAVGTGQALALAARGEADVVLAHAPELEQRYVTDGVLINRRLVMTNDFLLVGPPEDPAGVRGAKDPAEAFRAVARRARFVSRGDSSGTNLRELRLWTMAGERPPQERYIEVGQGMAATLRIASEKGGYTLSDRGTWMALRQGVHLTPMVEGDPSLLNVYSVSEVNPARFPRVNAEGARAFAAFLLSPEVQRLIGTYGVARFGGQLFIPAAGQEGDGSPR